MTLALSSLASGSSGNCYIVASETTTLIVDAGISGKQICEGLRSFGRENADALLITHEHSDHIKSVPMMIKKGIMLYSNEKTLGAIGAADSDNHCCFNTGDIFFIGDIEVSTFHLSHDAADPTGYSFSKDGKCISIITDTGCVTDECYRYLRKSDILVLESNHDESMLRVGRYPWFLKQRILSDKGHLSNDAAAAAIRDVIKQDVMTGCEKERLVLLAHLSRENNFPEMALATVNNILECEGLRCQNRLKLIALDRQSQSPVYIL